MGGLSLRVLQDCIFGRKHHGGALALGGSFWPKIDFRLSRMLVQNLHTNDHLSYGCQATPAIVLIVMVSRKPGAQIWVGAELGFRFTGLIFARFKDGLWV